MNIVLRSWRSTWATAFACVWVCACGGRNDPLPPPSPAGAAATVTTAPSAVALVAGNSATFTAVADGTPAPTLRWFIVGGADLSDGAGAGVLAGATVAGASTATLTISNTPLSANGLQLALRASNGVGSAAISASAALTVSAAGTLVNAATGGAARAPGDAMLLEIPPGALTADTTITFTPVASIATFGDEFPVVPGTQWELQLIGGEFIAGQTLRVRVKFDPAALPAGAGRARVQSIVRRASVPGRPEGAPLMVGVCEAGDPVTAFADTDIDNYANSNLAVCEDTAGQTRRRLLAIGLVVRRPAVPGSAVFEQDIAPLLTSLFRVDQAQLDRSGQTTLAYRTLEPDPNRPGRQVERQRLARLGSTGGVMVNTLTPGETYSQFQIRQTADSGTVVGIWGRNDPSVESSAQRIEVYGQMPTGSGRLLTGQRFGRSLSFATAAGGTPSGLAFTAAGGVAVVGNTAANESTPNPWGLLSTTRSFLGLLDPAGTLAFAKEASGNFSGRPDTAGIFARSDGPDSVAVDAAGAIYVVGGSDVNNSVTAFCSPQCPAIYKFSATGDPVWFRVLGGGASGAAAPSVAIDRRGNPVVRYVSVGGNHAAARLDPATGNLTGQVQLASALGNVPPYGLGFDDANNSYVGIGRFLFRIPADFTGAGLVTLEFGQGQTGDYRALGADRNGSAYGLFVNFNATSSAQLRLIKRTFP